MFLCLSILTFINIDSILVQYFRGKEEQNRMKQFFLMELLKALADETRLTIVDMLTKQELCACHILERVEISQSTLSYHMKTLTDAGLVLSAKNSYWTNYRLNPSALNFLLIHAEGLAAAKPLPPSNTPAPMKGGE